MPSFVESMNIREKYEHKVENLKQELTKTIVNNSVKEIVQAQNLQAKLELIMFWHKCQTKLYESRQSELTERLKKLEDMHGSNNTTLPLKLDSDTSGYEKPCFNVTEPRANVLMLERIITEKDKFISKLQDNLENLSSVVLKQRKVLLLSTELVRIQRVLLDFCSSKLKNVSTSTLTHAESLAKTHRPEVDQTIGAFPITNSEIVSATNLNEETLKMRTHFYHLESTFCSQNGQKYTYQSEPEGPQNPKRSRLKTLWLTAANHRYLDIPHTLETNESFTVWAKVHSDDDKFYYLELKPRNI